ncbi:MAG: DUF3846 domain-containing protein [Muribaculaceae bacterium]|nr:DUF3846 domain-containing protein [Muribaculaceae bacterium]
MARLIKAIGGEVEISPQNGKKFGLKEAQELVSGYIQIIPLDGENVMVMDEEGKFKHNIANAIATRIAEQHNALFPGDYIVGDVIICKNDEI